MKKKWSAAIGIIGLVFIFIPSITGDLLLLPLVAAIISGLAIAAVTVIAKQLPYNTAQSTIVIWIASVLANIPMMFILEEQIPSFAWQIEWVYLLLFAVASILATWSLLHGLKYIEAGTAGILGLLEIVFTVALGIILFNEHIELLTWVGIILIIYSAAFPFFNLKNKKVK